MNRNGASVFVGCSGWQYASWRGPFYPPNLPASQWLAFYASHFPTIEINNSFYRLPEKRTFAAWRDATPARFLISVKASRYLTHLKRLRQPGPPLDRLFRRVAVLGSRLGPLLYQLPATLRYDPERLDRFIRALQRQSVAALARNAASPAVRSRPDLRIGPLRHVIEFRDVSWYRPDTFDALARAGIAACLHDMAGSTLEECASAPFVYVRFHGTEGKYHGTYSDAVLRHWSGRLRCALDQGRDAYAYFNNDLGGTAVENARTLIRYVTGS